MKDDNDDIISLYNSMSTEQPTESQNNKILSLAKQSQATSKAQRSMVKYLPYSMAASVALVAVIVHQFPQQETLLVPDTLPPIQQIPQALPQADEIPQWQYSEEAQLTETEAKHDAMPKRALSQKANNSTVLGSKTQYQNTQQARQLAVIERAIKSNKTKQAVEEIEKYIIIYQLDSLPEPYKIFYYKHRSPSN